MRVAALSFGDLDVMSAEGYQQYLRQKLAFLAGEQHCLTVLPGLAGLFLAFRFGVLGQVQCLNEAVHRVIESAESWEEGFEQIHREAAQSLSTWLVPGSLFVKENGRIYLETILISPGGDVAGRQRQTFLSRREKAWGLSRGTDFSVFETDLGRVGLILGTDAWYPETGRILGLKGADMVCHCGAVPAAENIWRQLAGMWQQVQQNQFFCVESQLCREFAGEAFQAKSLIHAPCEMTDGFTGILASGTDDGLPVTAVLDAQRRKRVIANYPLLKLLNPAAYGPLRQQGGGGL